MAILPKDKNPSKKSVERTGKRSLAISRWFRDIENRTPLSMIDLDAIKAINGKIICIIEYKEWSPELFEQRMLPKRISKHYYDIAKALKVPAYLVIVNDPITFVPRYIYFETNADREKLVDPELRVYEILGYTRKDLRFVNEFNTEEYEEFLLNHRYERGVL